jgi:hypothetical protein
LRSGQRKPQDGRVVNAKVKLEKDFGFDELVLILTRQIVEQ